MKQNRSVYSRQNDKAAITMLKASYRCLRNERIAKYVMLFLSFGICLAAILNKYLPQMFGDTAKVEDVQARAATYINLISGVILVVGIAVGFYTSRMHTEGTVLQDRYEAHVFDNPPNLAILRPISQTVINVYAQKVRKKDAAFRDNLCAQPDDPDPDTAQFNYINDVAHSDYRLYISIQPFFMTLWIGFCVIIVILAVSFNDTFVTTLINIMIPSLSAITTIGNSWHNCRLQIRQLQNLINVIDQIQRLPDEKRLEYIRDKRNMRALADGLYNYRISPFVIPNFLVRRHLKLIAERSTSMTISQKHLRTEMPTLILPDLEAAEQEISEMIGRSIEIRTVSYCPTRPVAEVAKNNKRYTARTNTSRAARSAAAQKAKEQAKPVAKEPVKPAAKEPVKPAAKEPAKPAPKEPVKPAAKEPVKPAAKEPAKPAVKETPKPAAKEPAKEAAKPAKK